MKHFSQDGLRLRKNWGDTYRAGLMRAVAGLPKFVPMPELSRLSGVQTSALDHAPFDAFRAEIGAAKGAIATMQAAVEHLRDTPDHNPQPACALESESLSSEANVRQAPPQGTMK
jgi:hypothetical protein